jgi:beta-glucosidase
MGFFIGSLVQVSANCPMREVQVVLSYERVMAASTTALKTLAGVFLLYQTKQHRSGQPAPHISLERASMRLHWITVFAISATTATVTAPAWQPVRAQTPDADIEQRIEALVNRMTIEEKLGQMSQTTFPKPLTENVRQEIRKGRWSSFFNGGTPEEKAELQRIALKESRLGIPLIFGHDVIHGYQTVFPIPLGQAASWDADLIRQAARIAAREASADGVNWTFSPMIDIARDPRWGRIAESLGEDPLVTGVLGAAMVRGFQGESLDAPGSIAACGKHYVGYGAAEAGRDYNTTWIPEPLLREVYLKPFKFAKDAGVATYMTAFNDLNGVPASANSFTIRRVLHDEWRFNGFVVSDYTSIHELIEHGYAADGKDAALKAALAGVDMEMVSTDYFDYLPSLIKAGKVDLKLIDQSVRNILRVKFHLGLFSQRTPRPPDDTAKLNSEPLTVARRLAAESLVLLKNERGTLPLAKSIGKVAVVGPLADSAQDQVGTWVISGRIDQVRTPLAAIRQALGESRVLWAPGLKTSRDTSHDGFKAAVQAARKADAVLLFLGEEAILSGEAHSRAFLNLTGAQEELVEEVARTSKPIVVIILAGRPLTFQRLTAKVNALLYAWHPGTMGGPAITDVVFGDAVPAGKLTATFPRTVGQVPIYYAHKNTGRPASPKDLGVPTGVPRDPTGYVSRYLDVDHTPEYPFGFGLSYTQFAYSGLAVTSDQIRPGEQLTVSAKITNAGAREADEIVQLYTRNLVGSVTRPVRELKGFRRIRLKPGESKTVEFTLGTKDLAYYNAQMQLVTEPGKFHVWIAPDSVSGVRGEFEVVK